MRFPSIMLWTVPLLVAASAAFGSDFTRAEVESKLSAAPEGPRPSFAGRSLAGLDLHALDFHEVDLTSADLSRADLSDADLRGAKLVAANLTGAKLRQAKLNLAWIMRANFSHADLSHAILETLVASAGMETQPDEAAKFVGADLSGAKVTARFSLDDMRGANLSHLKASADMRNQSMGLIRTDFSRANLADVNFEGAELAYVNFEFAKLQHANFSGADLSNADFAGADDRLALCLHGAETSKDLGALDARHASSSCAAPGEPRAEQAAELGGDLRGETRVVDMFRHADETARTGLTYGRFQRAEQFHIRSRI